MAQISQTLDLSADTARPLFDEIAFDVQALRKTLALQVDHHVPDLEPCILDPRRRPVRRSRQRPDQGMRPRLEDPVTLQHDLTQPGDPLITPALVAVPSLAHERDARRWIGHHRVDRLIRQGAQNFQAIAMVQGYGVTHARTLSGFGRRPLVTDGIDPNGGGSSSAAITISSIRVSDAMSRIAPESIARRSRITSTPTHPPRRRAARVLYACAATIGTTPFPQARSRSTREAVPSTIPRTAG